MVPHTRHHRTRQFANILGNCCMRQRQEWGTMAATIGHLGHDLSMDIVGWLWAVLYVGICTVLYRQSVIPFRRGDDEHSCWHQSCGKTASTPNWLLCHVIQAATSFGNDAWWRRQQTRRKKSSGRRQFLQQVSLRIDQSWWLPLSYGHHGAPLLAFKHTSIS